MAALISMGLRVSKFRGARKPQSIDSDRHTCMTDTPRCELSCGLSGGTTMRSPGKERSDPNSVPGIRICHGTRLRIERFASGVACAAHALATRWPRSATALQPADACSEARTFSKRLSHTRQYVSSTGALCIAPLSQFCAALQCRRALARCGQYLFREIGVPSRW
jgi:hypothetical protein